MKPLPLALCLLTLPQIQQISERTIPLIFHDQVEIVKLSEAQKEYLELNSKQVLTKAEQSRLTALVLSLETLPEAGSLPVSNTRAWLDNEIRRGVRKPLQGRN